MWPVHVVLHNLTIHMKNKRKYGKFTESQHSQRYSLNYHQKRWINGRKCGDNSREKLAIKLDLNWFKARSKESSLKAENRLYCKKPPLRYFRFYFVLEPCSRRARKNIKNYIIRTLWKNIVFERKNEAKCHLCDSRNCHFVNHKTCNIGYILKQQS